MSPLSQNLHKAIIDTILASPLNIESIPDEVERQLYEQILLVLEEQQGCFKNVGIVFKRM